MDRGCAVAVSALSSLFLISVLSAAPVAGPVSQNHVAQPATAQVRVAAQHQAVPPPHGRSVPQNQAAASQSAQVRAALESVAPEDDPLPEVGVPFACGASFPVSQGHATGSHLHYDTHAWDFRMPEGTPITAARDGVVRLARGDSRIGGCSPSMAAHTNYVVLQHDGDLETQYLHFSRVVVKPGDQVKAGELIGYSGNTGWSCGPHLHFKVAQRKGNGWNNPSRPALLAGFGDPVRGTLVSAPSCDGIEAEKQYARADDAETQSPVADVAIGATLPGGPVNAPATVIGGAQAPATVPARGASAPGAQRLIDGVERAAARSDAPGRGMDGPQLESPRGPRGLAAPQSTDDAERSGRSGPSRR